MYIVLKKQDNSDNVINMFYNREIGIKWMNDYINEFKNNINTDENNTGDYVIKVDDNCVNLVKIEQFIKKGFFTNEKRKTETNICEIHLLEFDCKDVPVYNFELTENIKLWENINNEINNRVIKKMDQDSLYQYIIMLKTNINLKREWTSNEYMHLSNEYLKTFRKELYSNVAKKMRRKGQNF